MSRDTRVSLWFFGLYIPTIVLILTLTHVGWDNPLLFVATIITTIVWTRWAANLVVGREAHE